MSTNVLPEEVLLTSDVITCLARDQHHRLWVQRAVLGRTGPAGTPSGPLEDVEFLASLRATMRARGEPLPDASEAIAVARATAGPEAADLAELLVQQYADCYGAPDRECACRTGRNAAEMVDTMSAEARYRAMAACSAIADAIAEPAADVSLTADHAGARVLVRGVRLTGAREYEALLALRRLLERA